MWGKCILRVHSSIRARTPLTPRRIRTAAIALAMRDGSRRRAAAQIPTSLRLQAREAAAPAPPARPERDSAKFLEADRIEGEPDKQRRRHRQRDAAPARRHDPRRSRRIPRRRPDRGRHRRRARSSATATPPPARACTTTSTTTPARWTRRCSSFPRRPERRTASRGQAARAVLEPRTAEPPRPGANTPRARCRATTGSSACASSTSTARATSAPRTTRPCSSSALPILYSPYLSFPLDNKRRKSASSRPRSAPPGKSGFDMSLPYYLNLAENCDATLTPKLFTKRGVQLGAEFRYLEPQVRRARSTASSCPTTAIAEQRPLLPRPAPHAAASGPGWQLRASTRRRSPTTTTSATCRRAIAAHLADQPAARRDRSPTTTTSGRSRRACSATRRCRIPRARRRSRFPYKILPQLLADGREAERRAASTGSSPRELSNFRHPTLVNGQRVDRSIRRSPIRCGAATATSMPKLGYHFTRYNLDENTVGFDERARAACRSRASTRASSSTARSTLGRARLPADARAAPLLPQRAVPRPERSCPTSPPRSATSTSRSSSPRTASSAATASATRTSSRWRSPRA